MLSVNVSTGGVGLYYCLPFLLNNNCKYNYKDQSSWDKEYPECGGLQQSPIAIDNPSVLQRYQHCNEFTLENFDNNFQNVTMKNDGHKVSITLDPNEQMVPALSGGVLWRKYEFVRLDFHWGENDTTGTEHRYYRRRFAIETQAIFMAKEYGEDALEYDDGTVIFAGLFMVEKSATTSYLSSVVENLPNIVKAGTETTIDQLPALKHFITYYAPLHVTYIGSLTEPACNEGVRWFVSLNLLDCLSTDAPAFHQLKDHDGKNIISNVRDIQPLNDRLVLMGT